MKWIALGRSGESYPAEVRALRNKSGVYAIRKRGLLGATVVYVGESHTNNLYKTLTRHFQSWRRDKTWWRGWFGDTQTDPGHTYERDGYEVAFETCSKDKATALQSQWIGRLKPRDNRALVDELEEAPF